jgi:hypothetical protein
MSILSMMEEKHLRSLPPHTNESPELNSRMDSLVDVAAQLGKARDVAQSSQDSMLLYLLDMAIVHVCDLVCAASRPGISDDLERRRVEVVRAPAHEIE